MTKPGWIPCPHCRSMILEGDLHSCAASAAVPIATEQTLAELPTLGPGSVLKFTPTSPPMCRKRFIQEAAIALLAATELDREVDQYAAATAIERAETLANALFTEDNEA